MNHVIFTTGNESKAELTLRSNMREGTYFTAMPSNDPHHHKKATLLVTRAPSYTHVNGTLMTAEKGASTSDVLKLYQTRQKR